MSSLIMELGYNQILSAETAVSLRNYIASRNPSPSPQLRAGIFSDAVNRIVDGRMPKFSQDTAKNLKEQLFRDIAQKPAFSVDCGDVFKAAVGMKTLGYEFFRELNGWLSAVLQKEIVRESLFDFVMQAHRLMALRPEDDMADILESAERATGGVRYTVPEPVLASIEAAMAVQEEAGGAQNGFSSDDGNVKNELEKCVVPGSDTYEGGVGIEPERPSVSDIIKNSVLSARTRKPTAPAVITAAALAVMLFAGFKSAADSSLTNPDNAHNLPPITYTAAFGTGGETPAGGLPEAGPESIRMRATAYDLSKESCGKSPDHPLYGITSSGTRAAVGRTVAVDPAVIPLGSRVSITFPAEYSELDGVYIAEDTGRLIKGDSIDIFFGEDKTGSREVYESAMEFGVRYVDVKVLD